MSRTQATTGLSNPNITGVRSGDSMPTIQSDRQEENLRFGELRLSQQSKLLRRVLSNSNRHRQLRRSNQKIVLSP